MDVLLRTITCSDCKRLLAMIVMAAVRRPMTLVCPDCRCIEPIKPLRPLETAAQTCYTEEDSSSCSAVIATGKNGARG